MKSQDILVVLKIMVKSRRKESMKQIDLAYELKISQSEVSSAINRLKYSGLLTSDVKIVPRAVNYFLIYGLKYAFPARPGSLVRGVPTAHSAPLAKNIFGDTQEKYVWQCASGKVRGQSVVPLFKSVPEATEIDSELYDLLALIDMIRVGNVRESTTAVNEITFRIVGATKRG